MLKTKILLLLLSCLFFVACERDRAATDDISSELRRAIQAATKDGNVSAAECTDLREKAKAENPDLLLTETGWKTVLRSNLSRNVEELTIDCPTAATASVADTKSSCEDQPNVAHFYVENSRSMYGYLVGGSDFQEVMSDYVVQFDKRQQDFELYFINNDVFPVQDQPGKYKGATDIFERKRHFESYLNFQKMDGLGKTGSSKLMEILNVVTDNAVSTCEAQFLVSDYIYSLSGVSNMKREMDGIKSDVSLLVGKVADAGLGTLLIKYSSEFDGRFFPFDSPNKGFAYKGQRPYYVWVFGSPTYLRTLVSKYSLDQQAGYEASSLYLPGQKEQPAYGIFPNSGYPYGEFRKSPLDADPVLALSNVAASDRRGEEGLRFALGVDLIQYPVNSDYLMNTANFSVQGPDEENWLIADIIPLTDGLSGRDQRLVGATNPTHLIMLQADDIESKSSTIHVRFIDQKAPWLAQTHTDDDSRPLIEKVTDKTFGFSYLTDGVWDAYHDRSAAPAYFFDLPLILSR